MVVTTVRSRTVRAGLTVTAQVIGSTHGVCGSHLERVDIMGFDQRDGEYRATVNVGQDGIIEATWVGGAYVNLAFYTRMESVAPPAPSEVVNVWDYAAGDVSSTLPNMRAANNAVSDAHAVREGWTGTPRPFPRQGAVTAELRKVVREWVKDTRAEWPGFFGDYLRNR